MSKPDGHPRNDEVFSMDRQLFTFQSYISIVLYLLLFLLTAAQTGQRAASVPPVDEAITLLADFPGANPQGAGTILREAPYSYLIRPFSEDPNRPRFNLTIATENRKSKPTEVSLRIEWKESPKLQLENMLYRQRIAVGQGDSWTWYESSSIQGAVAHFRPLVPPGRSYVVLNPKYTSDDLDQFLVRIPSKCFENIDYGRTAQGRDVRVLRFSHPSVGTRPAVLVTARVHPDETAGSFAAEGVIRFLCSEAAKALLEQFDFYVVPMANPDGVETGLCKLTAVGGVDLPYAVGSSDLTSKVLMKLVHAIKPVIYLDLHQWWLKRDWIESFVLDPEWNAHLFLSLERYKFFDRGWQISVVRATSEAPTDLRAYCSNKWGTRSISLSLVWGHVGKIGRSCDEIRKAGEYALRSMCSTR